jgi:hypothetical protein
MEAIIAIFMQDFLWMPLTLDQYESYIRALRHDSRVLRTPGVALDPWTVVLNTHLPRDLQNWTRDHLILGHMNTPWSFAQLTACRFTQRYLDDHTPLWNEWWGDCGAAWLEWQRQYHTVPSPQDLSTLIASRQATYEEFLVSSFSSSQ